jgi:peroxiredoxin
MRKIAILLAFVLMLCLCGCESEKTSISTTQPTDSVDVGFALGQKMPDLTVTTSDGQERNVSQLLREKELVVLNFWFADCGWCVKEFPAMEVAYQRYKDSVEILALNPVDETSRITAFQGEHGLTFPMMSCTRDTSLGFGVNAYPTSVFIDRTGTICLIQSGAITDTTVFYNIFDHFTGDDYQQKIFKDLSELN